MREEFEASEIRVQALNPLLRALRNQLGAVLHELFFGQPDVSGPLLQGELCRVHCLLGLRVSGHRPRTSLKLQQSPFMLTESVRTCIVNHLPTFDRRRGNRGVWARGPGAGDCGRRPGAARRWGGAGERFAKKLALRMDATLAVRQTHLITCLPPHPLLQAGSRT